jgi:hypothetical protein
MFKQSCFIRKNTPELRQYLDMIGYKYGGKASKFEQPYLYCSLDKYFECNSFPARYHAIINCAENEDLFLALAALRDDSNYMQWFTNGETWFQNKQNDIEVIHYGAGNPINFHKAKVNELLEHFKD